MPKDKRKTSIDCTHLLNFKTNIPSDLESSATVSSSSSRNRNRKNHNPRKHDPKKQAAEREEKWTRQKLQSSFYLHSSASHSFVLKRTPGYSKTQNQQQVVVGNQKALGNLDKARYLKLNGLTNENSNLADAVVDWDAVQVVKVQVPTSTCSGVMQASDDPVDASIMKCSICLDSFVAPRITKCGHIYCYSCVLRHFHVSDGDNAMKQKAGAVGELKRHRESIAKCPCCFNYIQLSELKPVEFVTVQSPFRKIGNGGGNGNGASTISMTFRKCYRKKGSLVPYLPFQIDEQQNTPEKTNSATTQNTEKLVFIRKRIDSNDIPSVKSLDAPYCRFNYMDISTYIQQLQHDMTLLRYDMENIIELYKNIKGAMKNNGNLDRYFVNMALEAVQAEFDAAVSLSKEQTNLMNEQESRYSNLNKVKVLPYEPHCDHGKQSKADNTKYSIDSDLAGSEDTLHQKKKGKTRSRSNSMLLLPGTTYLDNDSVQFYQAIDGQLCFLCGFNLRCLTYEFLDKNPNITSHDQNNSDTASSACLVNPNRPPFPDVISGQIIDVQTVHLTPEVRRRMPFTSHLPLYVDINLVEVNLTPLLSPKTRDHFRSELDQRKKKRQAQRNAERKAKKKAEKEEQDRIEKLKEGMQRIDVNDDFFHAVVPTTQREDEVLVGDAFGPSISSSQTNVYDTRTNAPQASYANSIHRSYGSVCASNGFFPQLDASNDAAFPSLGASTAFPSLSSSPGTSVAKQKNQRSEVHVPKVMKTQSPLIGKSKKKNKVMLFSTGGRRGFA